LHSYNVGKCLLFTSFYLTISVSPLHFSPKAKWKVNKICKKQIYVLYNKYVMLFIEIQNVSCKSVAIYFAWPFIIFTLALSPQSKMKYSRNLTKWQRLLRNSTFHIDLPYVVMVLNSWVRNNMWYVISRNNIYKLQYYFVYSAVDFWFYFVAWPYLITLALSPKSNGPKTKI